MSEIPFLDSIQDYLNPHINRKWTTGTPLLIDPTGARGGGPAWVSSGFGLSRTFVFEYPSITMGSAIKFGSYPPGFLYQTKNVAYTDGHTPNLVIQNDGRLKVQSSFFTGNTSWVLPFVCNLGVWYFIEMNFTFGASAGKALFNWEVRVDDAVISTGSSLGIFSLASSNQPAGGPLMAQIITNQDGNNTGEYKQCDFYCTTGEFLHDGRCIAYFPRLDGTYVAGVPSIAGSHFDMINEHDPDDATTTLYLPAVADRDSRFMDLVAGYKTIKAVQYNWCARKDQPGVSSFKGILKSGASEILTRQMFPNNSAYLKFIEGYRKSPHTTLDYTMAELNAQEVGEERIT